VLPSCCVLADIGKFKRDVGDAGPGPGTLLRKAGAHMGCGALRISAPCLQGTQPGRFILNLWMPSCEALLHKSL